MKLQPLRTNPHYGIPSPFTPFPQWRPRFARGCDFSPGRLPTPPRAPASRSGPLPAALRRPRPPSARRAAPTGPRRCATTRARRLGPHSGPRAFLARPPQEATAERLSSAETGPDPGSPLARPRSGPPRRLESPPRDPEGLTGDWRSSPEALRKAFGRYGAQRSGVDPGALWAWAAEVEAVEEEATLGEKLANVARREAEEEQRRRER
ncbi:uncharacterized protein LOC116938333 [Petromyzon marinus]|uniref:uncharacterized protein LOC116938333 n=1 Tax=Petromyzon marinus TaxID=7757 RepID=UPI003F6FAD28